MALLAFFTGLLSAIAYTSVRHLKAYYDPRTVVLSFMIFGVLIPAVLLLVPIHHPWLGFVHTTWVMPQGWQWLWIFLMGVSAAMGQVLMTQAYFHAPAGAVSTMSYSVVVFATVFGIFLGDPLPSVNTWMGGLLIVASGVVLGMWRGSSS